MGLYGSNDGSKKISTTESPNLFGRIVSTVALSLTLTMMIYDTTALDVVVPRLQTYFSITDSTAALLQTLTTVTASVALIVVGAIGDRVQKRRVHSGCHHLSSTLGVQEEKKSTELFPILGNRLDQYRELAVRRGTLLWSKLGALVTVLNILTLTISYYINLPCHFLMSFFGTPMGSILPQLVLVRLSYAILSLIPGLISSPSAQIAGMVVETFETFKLQTTFQISDAYRGDAEDALTRFNALAFAFFILLTFFFAATIMYLMIVKYYPMDVDRREVSGDYCEMSNVRRSPRVSPPFVNR
ncbi:hypothetical protein PRIPAC_76484 [Pristionchus pacificus]|nr:hypothetical protein PRIPAC_76484 [Pristionchus pacificus]